MFASEQHQVLLTQEYLVLTVLKIIVNPLQIWDHVLHVRANLERYNVLRFQMPPIFCQVSASLAGLSLILKLPNIASLLKGYTRLGIALL